MKCALVIPAWSPREIFASGTARSQVNYWQPLGILYVASSLRRAGHEVRFFDGAFLSHEEMLASVAAFRPDFAGVYATAFGWPRARRTVVDLKRVDPNIVTCAGGPYPIAVGVECLGDAGVALDAVVTGEGERTAVELVERLAHGRSLDGVAGVIARERGRIVVNPARALIEDLDALPFPARDLLGATSRYVPPHGTYRRAPVATMVTSRGCDRRCLFCFQIDRRREAGRRGVRYRSVPNVLAEMEQCLRDGYREIKFLDDSLAADYDRAMELAREIRARRLDVVWFASACVNQVDRPLLEAFKDAGCWAILFGAESGVQKNLNAVRKGVTLEQTRQAVRAARDVGLSVSTPFIFGLPGETVEDALQTIEFALELDPDIASFHALTPFPGTDLHDRSADLGSASVELDDYTYQGRAFVPHTMTRDEIATLRQLAYRRFYSRPSFLARRVLRLHTMSDLRAAAAGARSLLALWTDHQVFEQRNRAGVTASVTGRAARILGAEPDSSGR